ncbi:MAG: hypothetical protein EA378_08785 [Phycisphaerales bacterium]|nr:MAG: hypothetical protein EA378_08785 [Phycisphaerales bacterium]
MNLGLAMLALTGTAAAAVEINFTRLARSGDQVPGGTETFVNFSAPSASNGNYAWSGEAVGASGIYARINGVDQAIARSGDANPAGGTFTDSNFGLALGKIDGEDVAFRAAGGIYARFAGNPLQLIANTSTLNPNTGSNYTNFQQPYISSGGIGFMNAASGPQLSMTVFAGGTLNPVISANDTLPAPMSGNLRLAGQGVYKDGIVGIQVFDSGSPSRQGILTNRGGSFNMIASGYQNIPGQSFNFGQFLDPTIQGDHIAFIAWGPNGTGPNGVGSYKGIFLDDNTNPLTTLVDTNTFLSDGRRITDLTRGPGLFGDTMLFIAGVDGGNALANVFAYYEGEIVSIADTSTPIDGRMPASFNIAADGALYAEDRGVFLVNFTDGSRGIYAFVIPAPGTGVLIAAAGLVCARRRRA